MPGHTPLTMPRYKARDAAPIAGQWAGPGLAFGVARDAPSVPHADTADRLPWPMAARAILLLSSALWVMIWRLCAQLF